MPGSGSTTASTPPSPPSGPTVRRSAFLRVALVLAVVAALGTTGWLVQRAQSSDRTFEHGASIPPVTSSQPLPSRAGGYPLVGTQFQGTWSTYTDAERIELLDDLVAMGVRTVRIGVSWAMLQPDRPRAGNAGWNWDWGVPRVDSVVQMALSRGLLVHATFGRTPAWANDGAGEAAAPTSLADWRRAVSFVAHRYAGKVTSWEIWNEPNLPKYFIDGSPASYTRLLCAAYPIMHAVSPQTPVVYGGLNGNDWRFLESSYSAGAKGCFDVLAVHPYQRSGYAPDAPAPDDEPWYFANVSLVRSVQQEHDDLKPMWFTELGWSTHSNAPETPEYQRGVSDQQQASYLVRTLQLTKQRYPYVSRVYIYSARNETGFDQENNNFGLYSLSLQPKPAVGALRRYLSGS